MTQLYQSKIFANGSTTLPKPVRDALGVKAGDSVRYVISENGVQVLKRLSHDNSLKVHAHDPALREALDAAEEVMEETASFCESLNKYWSPKCGATQIKQCQCFIRPYVLR